MKAENNPIEYWLEDIRRGVVQLPRFQRKETWDHNHVKNFLDTVVIYDRPIGILLTLDVDPKKQPFETRPLEGAESKNETCRIHLLDGQQRLTALWKALNDKYEDRLYFIKFGEEGEKYVCTSIEGITRKSSLWVNDPKEVIDRNYIPLSLLYPKDAVSKIELWFSSIKGHDTDKIVKLRMLATNLWKRVSDKIFPSFSLPQSTTPDDAIDIFISTNTSFVKLTPYNIAVAQFEAKTQDSLQGIVDRIGNEVSGIIDLEGEDDLGDLVLKVACLFQGKMPTYSNYKKLDMVEVNDQQNKILEGIRWATNLINYQRIWKKDFLPTSVPLRVLPALYEYLPKHGDNRAKADRLIRRYIWLSFFTNRYDRQANGRLYSDYGEIKNALVNKTFECASTKTVFSESLPTKDDLMSESWPKTKGIRKRAILAACNHEGGRDIASDRPISPEHNRHYHHIFPKGLFKKLNVMECDSELALNCMLIEGHSNQQWSDRWPGDYILERINESGINDGDKAKNELRQRLESHLLPPDAVLDATENNKNDLDKIYNDFIRQRADLVIGKMKQLCAS